VTDNLPVYARPLFLRILPAMDTTSTLKFTKVTLRDEGFNPNTIKDPLYFRDDANKTFVPITPALYDEIITGTIKAKL
jgi:hypothetical protein